MCIKGKGLADAGLLILEKVYVNGFLEGYEKALT